MSRRGSGQWGRAAPPLDAELDVLIPAFGRPAELAVTLAGLAGQDSPSFRVIISDQTEDVPVWESPSVSAMVRVLQAQGREVQLERNLPRRGMAQQRQFLLDQSRCAQVLFLDSDVWLEPDMLRRMSEALASAGCGFVGAAVQGLSYLDDYREHELEPLELWEGGVKPERVRQEEPAFQRWRLHNAANLTHAAAGMDIPSSGWRLYKIAWVGGCVIFDRAALVECGGFDFWDELPSNHAGEDIAAQWRVLERHGGAGILPSGAVHLEAPTTVADRSTDAADVVHGTSGE
ncbi:GT2 family glycosyltransferase [Arthrobacter pigmenti]|uniref:GT2 family glycosyltransferase n=1 Tax=Arthrobacter pigmenti TaxID=271432 RepID=A0A846RQI5_9MICC|nr:glycosyltransferase family A protein [Arthrobacter pigmenti]NJC21366.1 GT2 family glycosyltransferase [Arthrobacter pigmenti]